MFALCLQGAHGIDFRYCRGGFYGKGIYLAEDAEYSHSYTHTTSDNNYQMFMARAAVGKVEQRDKPDQNIVHPKPGHHSIRGPVRGIHQAYICYESYMACKSGRRIPIDFLFACLDGQALAHVLFWTPSHNVLTMRTLVIDFCCRPRVPNHIFEVKTLAHDVQYGERTFKPST